MTSRLACTHKRDWVLTAVITDHPQDTYDCSISDYETPEMNGLEFRQRGREDALKLPFILYTGKGSEEIAAEAISQVSRTIFGRNRGPSTRCQRTGCKTPSRPAETNYRPRVVTAQ
ncbi:hypothetical protein AMS69_12535 [Haloarcula rubripromontorii]|uniref:Response regulatory domain-containing protein n=1 Tax=Haloarcula rubripromontorii TaxID=1705562 RepID=A0A0N0BNB0_9EURY|nr:hypothetical protein AMS69_12535 [Haloarcula rubripromontorii]